ncbi:ABC transporter permease [Ancylobacter sp. 6x-1]|uniref:ABC transporter permease n=1 Tax=Ancylobacter crimeensis TaxID=2579147 RepID=A0ABT0DG61_9HYPH|nr:ABC transporter permease [Ancylobacter crimeensis]MCK0198955.1 ABC transporter permease [Ancylobacter crimeensis]
MAERLLPDGASEGLIAPPPFPAKPDTAPGPAPGPARTWLAHGRWLLPVAVLALAVLGWDLVVRLNALPPYILPGPGLVVSTLIKDWAVLSGSLLVTLRITALALATAVIGGGVLALVFAASRLVELSLFPIAVILQVTPVVAIAPLMLIYLEPGTAVLTCAFIVAFFPILSNTALGLNSVDPNLQDLFALSGASRWQSLILLRLPAALPYFLGGLRIAGGLALIGAIVAEIAAGSAGQGSGLAFRVVESGYRLNIPRMFAALLLISLTGILIHTVLSLVSWLALRRWHDSAVTRQ